MNVTVMRHIDRLLGIPACALLTLARHLRDWLVTSKPASEPRRVAAIKLAEQGATVVAYPALKRLADNIGRQNLYIVVFDQNRFIVDILKFVPPENVLVIRTRNGLQTLSDTLRVVAKLRRLRIDATIDCEFFARSTAIISYLSGAAIRVGFHAYHGDGAYRGNLLTHRLSYNAGLHVSEVFHLLVDTIWQDPTHLPAVDRLPVKGGPMPVYEPTPQSESAVNELIRSRLKTETIPPLILLNANRGDFLPLRAWPGDRYIELAKRLLDDNPDRAILFTGSPEETAGVAELVAAVDSPRCVSVAGRTSLDELFTLYCLADLMVTNDSGPAHYAAVTPMDVITLFGPESPTIFGSLSERSHHVWAGIACSPCVNAFNDRQSACHNNQCMQRITVDQIVELVGRVLSARRARTGG
ncbi:MAG: hypothetical protein O3A51_02735 [Verrucomicrobia bacterium]|nr:hypothetical protein [Verrucomicrobiota bacterium]